MQNGKESPLYEPLWFRKVLLTYLQLSTSRNLSTYFVIYVHHKATFSLQVFPPSFVLILGGVQHCPPRACTDPPPLPPPRMDKTSWTYSIQVLPPFFSYYLFCTSRNLSWYVHDEVITSLLLFSRPCFVLVKEGTTEWRLYIHIYNIYNIFEPW